MRATGCIQLVQFADLAHVAKSKPKYHGWPTCAHCCRTLADGTKVRRAVDSVNLLEEDKTSMTISGKCHGKEDVLRIDFGREVPFDDDSDGSHGTERCMAWRMLTFFEPEFSR